MKKGRFLEREGAQALIASLICILLGVLIGYIVLLCINPAGAIHRAAVHQSGRRQ